MKREPKPDRKKGVKDGADVERGCKQKSERNEGNRNTSANPVDGVWNPSSPFWPLFHM